MRTSITLVVLAGVALAAPAAAQKTGDQARLIFTMGLTYTGGTDLWSVQDQPINLPAGLVGFDLIDLNRSLTNSLGVLFSGTYYPKPALGLSGEIFFTGLGIRDRCATASPNPNPSTQEICSSIDGATKSTSSVLVSVGPILRIGSDKPLSPYIRAQVGLTFTSFSTIQTAGTVTISDSSSGASEVFQVLVYEDPSSVRVTPGFVFGAGITAATGKGWQIRAEVRDNLLEFATVAGPTPPGVDSPQVVNTWKNLFSIVIGADIVLEKKRGHRY